MIENQDVEMRFVDLASLAWLLPRARSMNTQLFNFDKIYIYWHFTFNISILKQATFKIVYIRFSVTVYFSTIAK